MKRFWIIVLIVIVLAVVTLYVVNRPAKLARSGDKPVAIQAVLMNEYTPQLDPRMTPVSATLTTKTRTRSTNCWKKTVIETYRGIGGFFLVSWNQVASWCVDAVHNSIVNYSFQTYAKFGNEFWNLWGCSGCPSMVAPAGNVAWQYQRADADFKACVAVVVCESMHIWVAQTIRPDGSYQPDGGGA